MNIKRILILVIVFAIFAGGVSVWWNIYKFKDCKKVGHSTLYCTGRLLGL